MEWIEVTIKTVSAAIEDLAAYLTAIGYDSFVIDDAADFESFLEENTQYWDYVDEELAAKMRDVSQIRLYIENDSRARERIMMLRQSMEGLRQRSDRYGSLEIALENIAEEDWANNWKQYYQPIDIGEKLRIVPEWLSPENPEGRVEIRLDPGMIFGTGGHASTQMCLTALEQHIRGGESVIDLGSGSGILSIAALLLGAGSAVGVDIDLKAEDIARENAALNSLTAPAFRAVSGNVLDDENPAISALKEEKYDIVLANIVADVIIPLSDAVPGLMKENGIFICSGILDKRADEVIAALNENGLKVTERYERNDWCCLAAVL